MFAVPIKLGEWPALPSCSTRTTSMCTIYMYIYTYIMNTILCSTQHEQSIDEQPATHSAKDSYTFSHFEPLTWLQNTEAAITRLYMHIR